MDVYAAQGSANTGKELERIAAFYAIEKEARGQPPERRAAIRSAKAAPCRDELERWLQSQLSWISAKTPLAPAVRRAQTRLNPLNRDSHPDCRAARIPDCKINRVDDLLPWNCPSAEDRQADACSRSGGQAGHILH